MSTLVAAFHHPVQAINKAAQVREAYNSGNHTVSQIQTWLQARGVQVSDAYVQQLLYKMNKKGSGASTLSLKNDAQKLLDNFKDATGSPVWAWVSGLKTTGSTDGTDENYSHSAFTSKAALKQAIDASINILEAAKEVASFLTAFDVYYKRQELIKETIKEIDWLQEVANDAKNDTDDGDFDSWLDVVEVRCNRGCT